MIFQAFPISFTAQWYPLALVDLPKERHLFLLSQVSFLVLIYWLGLEMTVNQQSTKRLPNSQLTVK